MTELRGRKVINVRWMTGSASFVTPTRIAVLAVQLLDGFAPFPGGAIEIDEKQIVSSTGALELQAVPKKVVVIGGSIIGLEMGSVWSRLGAEVTVVEFLGTIGGVGIDEEVAKQFQRILTKQGIKFKLNIKVLSADKGDGSVLVKTQCAKGEEQLRLDSDVVLVAVGHRPYAEGLNLEAIGVDKDNRGRIVIDDQFNTSVKSIKCIGDVTFGIAAVEYIKTGHGHVNYNAIPSVVYTHPEVAWVGQTEQDLGPPFPFAANSRAKTNVDSEGFVKFLSEKETDRILGVHIIGELCSTFREEATPRKRQLDIIHRQS
ncbi:hypothetical protein BU15DRAFT_90286 [Melanogaster broomeanus]|nr:hypothetical protein BU15DRAFT_90286 [Melanogaster broomeanus]